MKWKREIEWMTNKGSALWRRIFTGYLLITWTVISPVMITGILGFYVYDVVAVNPPSYRHWNETIGFWNRDENGTALFYEYEAGGKATIWILHLFVLIWLPIFFIKSFYKGLSS